MGIQSGTHLGPYEILSPVGAGGMGEVYRARDTKLGRDVALKVLPEAFARDPERMARFQREAKLLASLNHPNIAAIYGLEDSGGAHALVMELVEGPTLADRIRQGPIPVDEALRIAKQICEGLEYAHERGIVHRDLKPANVKVSRDDAVKVLDFGLAKAIEANGPSTESLHVSDLLHRMENLLEGGDSTTDIAQSPTISEMATRAGTLLGTAAYMSPEQAKAKPVDRRADIWAFGCVLYEMLTGERAFGGETVTDTLAAVIRAEPDWSELPAATPIRVRVLLQRCLQKEPRQRLQAIGDARIALDEVLSGAPDPATAGAAAARAPLWRRAAPWVLGFLAVIIAGAAVWMFKPSPPAASKAVTRFTITLPPGQQLAGLAQPALALSADGTQLAYVATNGSGPQQIYLRPMDGVDAKPVEDTQGAVDPFFSPDGQWLGFFAGEKLRKVSVKGGLAQTVADVAVNTSGGTWSAEHMIAFTAYASALQQVSDAGGIPQPLTHFEAGETIHTGPEFLPDGKAVLFAGQTANSAAIAVERIDSGERRDLVRGQTGYMPRYLPSGHLIYVQAGNLMAAPFDANRLEISGAAVPAVQNVLQITSGAQYSVSDSGSLVYVSGGSIGLGYRPVWVSRNGQEQVLNIPPRNYYQPRISPDGRRIVMDVIGTVDDIQVWLYDLSRDTVTPFTFGGINRHGVWTPDGKRIAFMSNREGPTQIFWKLADGNGNVERLTSGAANATVDVLPIPYSWSPDGQLLTYVKLYPTKASEFWVLHVRDGKTELLQESRAADGGPQFSPDGHWLAYASEESGRREIYVQAYPGPGGKWQVSTDGGNEPQWNRNGRELFYREGNKMMAVDVSTHSGFSAGKPRELFKGNYLATVGGYVRANYDVSPDGQRFLMLKPVEQTQAAPTQINVVLNWSEELKRLVPSQNK